MKTIERFFLGHMLLVVAALAVGLASSETALFTCSVLVVMLGLFWFTAQQRNASGMESLMLFLFVLCAGIGYWLGAPPWMMLLAVVFCIGAWDLDHFLQRLNQAERVELESGLGRAHLRRLLLVEAVGLLAGLVALNFQLRIGFWWETLLVLLVVIGISRIVARVRKETGG